MPKPFLILHLSDAHLGNPKYALDSFNVFESLFDDLRKMRTHLERAPDLIVFNGDLAFGHITECSLSVQYDQAEKWLDKVYQALGSSPDTSPILFVPGNHDINRTAITEDQTKWINESLDSESLYALIQSNSLQWRRYLERQAEWTAFVQRYPSNIFNLDTGVNITTGVLKLAGLRVGVVALNSSWASHQQEEDGKLWLGTYQIQTATRFLSDCEFKILATHHPISWLHTSEKTDAEIKVQSNFNLYLHGHVHEQWFVPTEGHLRVQAGAAYAGSVKPNGYSWIEIDFAQRHALLHLRSYTAGGSGGWISRQIPKMTNESGVAVVNSLFNGPGATIPLAKRESSTASAPIKTRPLHSQIPLGDLESPVLFASLTSIPDYISVLENIFSFRWEPSHCNLASPIAVTIYWPVRLRRPTVIHAVQAYAAAGLQRLGARVVLCLDDLGNAEDNPRAFSQRVTRWLSNSGANPQGLDIKTFSEIITTERYRAAWDLLQSWLSDAKYQLKDVLAISKIWPRDPDPNTLANVLSKKPRRLLTPALVWTCLVHLLEERAPSQIITLGGYDERSLWDAWRNSIKRTDPAGHMYIPELTQPDTVNAQQAVHMARPDSNLCWNSKEDIRFALMESMSIADWTESGRLLPWVLAGGVQLPRYLNALPLRLVVKGTPIRNISDLSSIDRTALTSAVESEISRYIF